MIESATRTRAVRVGLLCALALAAAAAATASGAAAPRTLTIGTLVAETSFDPYKNDAGYFLQYLQPVYDTLIERKSDGTFSPGIASSWGYARGSKNTEFRLVLRKGVKFSDGTPLDSAAVKANLEFAKGAAGPRAEELAAVESVDAPSPTTLVVHLSASDPSLPHTLSGVNGMVVSPKALLDPVGLDKQPVGAGPYVLDRTQTVPGERYTYVRSERYWRRVTLPYERIVIRVYANASAAFKAVKTGAVDAAPGAPADLVTGGQLGLKALTWPVNALGLWLWDRNGRLLPPLAKLGVRQALNSAVDRQAFFNTLYRGQGIPGTQIFVPGTPGHDPKLDTRYPYDPKRARQLLARAGYPKGFVLPVLSVAAADPQTAFVRNSLAAIGVRLQVNDVPSQTLAAEIAKPRFPALMWTYSWQDAYQDSRALVLPGGFFNPFDSDDAMIESLWKRAAEAPTASARRTLFRAESARIVDLAWFLMLGYDKSVYWLNPKRIKSATPSVAQPVPSLWTFRPKT
jgi:peptide/nickel transport system substrate-binding protein